MTLPSPIAKQLAPGSVPLFERIRHRPPRWARGVFYTVALIGFVAAEFKTELALFFPLVLALPVLIASWWDGRPIGYLLAALSMAPWTLNHSWPQWFMRAGALVVLIEVVCRASDMAKRVRVLEGLLPICMHCHRIRGEDEKWVRLEEYVDKHSEATFSHGICPICLQDSSGVKG